MRDKFNEQLDQLHIEMIEMGALCEDAISAAAESLLKSDPEMAKRAKECEKAIDDKEHDVETRCLRLLLQQQPVASDLREISSALKMISDLERIGDQAADIAELTPYITGDTTGHIGDMARAACEMVSESVGSFVKRDLDMARAVMASDDHMDALFDAVKFDLIAMIGGDSAKGELGLDLLMVAKYFERIGDHATNVAEWVEFSITGVHPQSN
ncbi:MAG: phosphate signaling complex protein PhoU [Oscillibacter sp.]|jgi:phosphate transport system protein|nr:phosphate signaling complex protein PhoU [Oscillibacter sp.]